MRIGVFGGTFDPPHTGHLRLAGIALRQLDLERVLWVLTPDPPHKQDQQISPYFHRLQMLTAMLAGRPEFEISQIENERPGPHYTVDTLQLLSRRRPGDQLFYLIGGDSLRDLPAWHRHLELVDACAGIAVLLRPGPPPDLNRLEQAIPGLSAKLHLLKAPPRRISSSAIRKNLARGKPVCCSLTRPVLRYIRMHNLYRRTAE